MAWLQHPVDCQHRWHVFIDDTTAYSRQTTFLCINLYMHTITNTSLVSMPAGAQSNTWLQWLRPRTTNMSRR